MSAETNEQRAGEPPKVPTLPAGMTQLPPPSPAVPGRVPPISSLISQGGPSKRGYGGVRPATPADATATAPAPSPDLARVPAAAAVISPSFQQRPPMPQVPTPQENYTTIHEAIAANAEPSQVFNMPALPVRESSAVPATSINVAQASQPEDFAQLYREAAGEPAATAPPPAPAAPAFPASMPAPPPPRRTAPSSAPLNAEEIPVSQIDPAELLKPSRRSHQSPYRGLQRFEQEDTEFYFGPRQLLVDVVDALDQTSLLCLTGPPACGKSSLLRAGVIPNWLELEGGHSHAFVFSPGEDPFVELGHTLLAAGCSEEVAAIAREPAHYLFRRIEEFLDDDERWLIVVDQFEEAGRGVEGADVPRDAAFMSSLVELARRPDSKIKVILALRDDFFWKLGHYPELAKASDKHLFRLIELTEKELQQAMVMPAREHGVELEKDLLLHILKDLPDQRPALPLVQHVLDVLWIARTPDQKELRLDDYLVLGGLSGALRRRLETIYAGLSQAGKAALRQALLRLVDVSGMSLESRGPGLTLPYRMALEDFTEIREREALEMLVAARLLMSRAGPRTIVELPVAVYMQAWPRFRRWIQEINEAVALRNQLAEDTGRWKFNVSRKGEPAGAKELWKGGHLEWAIELRERGDFDSLLGGLTRDEDAFLDASRAADVPRVVTLPTQAAAAPQPAPVLTPSVAAPVSAPAPAKAKATDVFPNLSQAEREDAAAELASATGTAPAAEPKPVTPVRAVPLTPPKTDTRKLTGQFYISKEEAAEREATVGGPSLKQKSAADKEELDKEMKAMELQHELIVREKQLRKFKLVLAGLAVVMVILFLLAMKGCMVSAKANAGTWGSAPESLVTSVIDDFSSAAQVRSYLMEL